MTEISRFRQDGTFFETPAEAIASIQEQAERLLPKEAVMENGIARIEHPTWTENLKPRAACMNCGEEQIFADTLGIVAANVLGGGCKACNGKLHLVSFFAPLDKLRRRVEDQLRKGPGIDIIQAAKVCGVSLGNI